MVNWSERGHVLATCDADVVYCRIVGQANMNNCSAFQQYSSRMRKSGVRRFVLDFSDCDSLDSTFLGVLVTIVLGDGGEPARVLVLNARESVRKTLAEIGIDRLLTVQTGEFELPKIPLRRLEPVDETNRQRAEMMLAAHEKLCEVEPENEARFGAFLAMLKLELDGDQS